MVLFKAARAKGNPQHVDNWTDIAGYAACGGGIATAVNDSGVTRFNQGPLPMAPQQESELFKTLREMRLG